MGIFPACPSNLPLDGCCTMQLRGSVSRALSPAGAGRARQAPQAAELSGGSVNLLPVKTHPQGAPFRPALSPRGSAFFWQWQAAINFCSWTGQRKGSEAVGIHHSHALCGGGGPDTGWRPGLLGRIPLQRPWLGSRHSWQQDKGCRNQGDAGRKPVTSKARARQALYLPHLHTRCFLL